MTERARTESMESGKQRRTKWWRAAAWSAAAVVLLAPLAAMLFTDEVNWTAADFVLAGALIVSTGAMYELAVKTTENTAYRAASGLALAGALLLIWVNGAVGIVGAEDNPANLLYGGVLAIGGAGAIAARFMPRGMSYALFATALAQAAVPVLALVVWEAPAAYAQAPAGMTAAFALNAGFAVLFGGAAWLFRKAAD